MEKINYGSYKYNKSIFLKAFLSYIESDKFESSLISSTKASYDGSGYSVELFVDGDFVIHWNNQIGNLYQSPGIIIGIPALDDDIWNSESENKVLEYLTEAFNNATEDENKVLEHLIETFNEATEDENKIAWYISSEAVETFEKFSTFFSDRFVDVCEKPSASGYSFYSGTFENIFSEDKLYDESKELMVEDFELKEDGCTFSIGYTAYEVTLSCYPSDKWGNYYDPDEGYLCRNGFYEIYYSNTSDSFYSDEWLDAVDSEITLDWDPRASFENWFQENYSKYDFIDKISENYECSGCWCGFEEIVTCKDPRDSQEWRKLFEDYRSEVLATK